ncbi:MAG: hypothetical protein MHMPM18_001389 [Marteilia pararefringens]
MPDKLLTLSVADNHWPQLQRFYTKCNRHDLDNDPLVFQATSPPLPRRLLHGRDTT